MPTTPDHELTVLIPARDEERRLPYTLAGLAGFLDAWGIDYRVVVVDDGSRDATAAIASRFGRRFSTERLPEHRGKGAAVRHGMLRATGAVAAFTDADLPYDLGALRTAHDWVAGGKCEVVFGARDLRESGFQARRRWSRTLASAAFREVVKHVVSREVTDTQCGLKVFSRGAALAIFSRTSIDGFAFDAEVVLLCHRLRLAFRRVPVTLINEYASTLSLSRHAWRMLRDVLSMGLTDRLRRGSVPPARELPEPNEAGEFGPKRRAA
ncbi:MAG TPA: glycosyltransferase [Pirellulales bacterium]|nr:glycosyltransferase [Pirellulales bacterium]